MPKDHAKNIPKNRTLTEVEWRGIGVQQSRGWEHYALHRPEPHILLFRRPLGTVYPIQSDYSFLTLNSLFQFYPQDPLTGEVDPELERDAKERYQQEVIINQRQ